MKEEYNPFNLKKKEGDIFENYSVFDINKKRGLYLFVDHPNKKFEYWDLIDEFKKWITIECKNDTYGHHKSNNVCIECGQYSLLDGKYSRSGILVTQSKFWLQSNGIEYEDATIYLAYSNIILKLFMDYKKFWEEYNILAYTYTGDEFNEKLNNLKIATKKIIGCAADALHPAGDGKLTVLSHYSVPQGVGQPKKPMDLFLVPRDIYKEYCLEFASKYNMTYKSIE
jgi:hypothetical protein